MFREDFEFNDNQAPSHLGGAKKTQSVHTPEESELEEVSSTQVLSTLSPPPQAHPAKGNDQSVEQSSSSISLSGEQKMQDLVQIWSQDAQNELKKIPFFVRGKAKRNTEKFAKETGVIHITVETLYDAKAHFSR